MYGSNFTSAGCRIWLEVQEYSTMAGSAGYGSAGCKEGLHEHVNRMAISFGLMFACTLININVT